MSNRNIIAAAYLLDWLAGDPEWFPHPVRLMGKCITQAERNLRRPGQTPATELVAGGVLTLSLVAGAYASTAGLIAWTRKKSPWLGVATELVLAWTCLASRSLHDEASATVRALESGDVIQARRQLGRIVGRDTHHLDDREISRALIETVAESASDGVMAPLFYMALGGVPLAMAYKAVNTLDSMIGHMDERYFYFGKVAARLDDAANFVPARLTALGITAASAVMEDTSATSAFDTWMRDGDKHKSLNSGQPESAMAGSLQVCLGGTNFYDGEMSEAPLIGEGFSHPAVRQAKQAIKVAAAISALGVGLAILLRGRNR